MTLGDQVKIFVGTRSEGPEGAEAKANVWLKANPLLEIRGVQTAATTREGVLLIVVTIWYSGEDTN